MYNFIENKYATSTIKNLWLGMQVKMMHNQHVKRACTTINKNTPFFLNINKCKCKAPATTNN
jgi:hypothetical protein